MKKQVNSIGKLLISDSMERLHTSRLTARHKSSTGGSLERLLSLVERHNAIDFQLSSFIQCHYHHTSFERRAMESNSPSTERFTCHISLIIRAEGNGT
jgi:hypothetical protein